MTDVVSFRLFGQVYATDAAMANRLAATLVTALMNNDPEAVPAMLAQGRLTGRIRPIDASPPDKETHHGDRHD